MNTEIIRGNALQVIELAEEVTRLTNELGYAQYDKDQKDKRINELEEKNKQLTTDLYATQSNLNKYKIMFEETKRITDGVKTSLMQEVTRLKSILARNGIKYKKVKNA